MNKELKFNLTPKEAVLEQNELRQNISTEPLKSEIKYIAGADVSCNMFGKYAYAGIVVFTYPELELIEYSCARTDMPFPYIPGLLSFREIPALLLALEGIKNRPDVIVVDGHGIAHPRHIGIASHFGLASGIPTIGCAKNILYGKTSMPRKEKGGREVIKDPKTDEVIGVSLRSKDNVNPVFVSPGHSISLSEAVEIIENSLKGYRLPEETRIAHNTVNEFRIWSMEDPKKNLLRKDFLRQQKL